MSRQFPCNRDAKNEHLKGHALDAKLQLKPNGDISITWGQNRWGATRAKTITGVKHDVTGYSLKDFPDKVYVGMTINVTNEEARPWFSSDSSRDGCQFICKEFKKSEESIAAQRFHNHIEALTNLINNWKGMQDDDRALIIDQVGKQIAGNVSTGSPALHALLRTGEFTLNTVGGALFIIFNMQ